MISKTLAIVIAAVVIVAGGASAVIFISSNNGDKELNVDLDSISLKVYGNANNDLTIDDDDKAIIQDIIDGKKSLEDYPFADVNYDGKVDEDDLVAVQRIIDRKEIVERGEKISLFVACWNLDCEKYVTEVSYPLENLALFGMSAINSTLCTNAESKIATYANHAGGYQDYPNAMKALKEKESFMIGNSGSVNFNWERLCEIGDEKHIDAFILDSAYAVLVDSAPGVKKSVMALAPVIGFDGNDVYAQIWGTALIGFLCGPDTEEIGYKFASDSKEILEKISSEVSKLTDKTTFMTFTRWVSVCNCGSPHHSLGILAGGKPYYEVNSEFKNQFPGSGVSYQFKKETLSNYKDCGVYISLTATDFRTPVDEAAKSLFEFSNDTLGNITVTDFMPGDTEKRLVFINNLLPVALKVAYIAQVLYPDLFPNCGYDAAQKFIDGGYTPFNGLTVEDLDALITYDDYANSTK